MTEHTDPDRADVVPPPPDRAAVPAGLQPRRGRVVGVDLARGVALMGMMAVHVFATLHSDYSPSRTQQLVAGHALATFVLLAGVSLAFGSRWDSSSSRDGSRSRWPDAPTAASMATRALLIGLIGLVLNYTDPPADVILPYYGAMFLLAIPLVRLSSRTLSAIALSLVVIAPLVVLASFAADLPSDEPTLGALAHPVELATTLLVSGSYPVVEYLAFICVGIAIGRLDLSARRVAVRLAAGGAALALVSWLASSVLMLQLGGLQHLRDAAPARLGASQARNVILWDPDPVLSWWWLAQRAPYTVTPLRMLHDLGVATAVLGVCLLVTRSRRLGWWCPAARGGRQHGPDPLHGAHPGARGVPVGGPARGAVRRPGPRLSGVRRPLEPYGAPGTARGAGLHGLSTGARPGGRRAALGAPVLTAHST